MSAVAYLKPVQSAPADELPHERQYGPALLRVTVQEKAFGDHAVLRNANVTLHEGEAAVLLGPSGCGKSTLLRIAAGLDAHFTGEISLAREGSAALAALSFVFQEPRLFPWLTVAQNIGWADGRKYDRSRVASLLEEVGLAGKAALLPKSLSGGMAQRVAIARALYTQPKVLLLDEPFSAVDAFTRMRLQDLVLGLIDRLGLSILVVTHDIDEALYLGDRIYMMGTNPGTIQRTLEVPLPHPRDRRDRQLGDMRSEVLTALHDAHLI